MPSYEVRNAKTLGAAIKHARLTKGIRQEDLADELGINPGYLRTLENGSKNLWSSRLFRTLRKLGITVTVSYEVPVAKDSSDA